MTTPASPSINRRRFLYGALTGAAIAPLDASVAASASVQLQDGKYREPERDIDLKRDADVIVCGGGPAGIAAAITAARAGARVRLFEVNGCLGGVWTAGLLGYLLDFDKPGFNKELLNRLDRYEARHSTNPRNVVYDPEAMKVLLEELCLEVGVTFQLHTRVTSAYRDGKRLTTIVTDSKSGREAWQAPVFIDTTGDGDLGALAGCAWDIGLGEQKDCPCQPMSMDALLVVKDAALLKEFIHIQAGPKGAGMPQSREKLREEIRRAGHEPSYGMPTLFQVRDNLLLAMMNHEYGIEPFNAAEVTQATVRARAEVHHMVRSLRKLGGVWDGIQVAATAEQIGVRDGRRIKGRYVVSKEDLVQGARHADAVTRATFSVDIHAVTKDDNKSAPFSNAGIKAVPYEIPLRALIAQDVDGLMMAGRCISGDYIAHSSYRVTGNAVAMGEAAGVVSALAALGGSMPHEVQWSAALAKLKEIGHRA